MEASTAGGSTRSRCSTSFRRSRFRILQVKWKSWLPTCLSRARRREQSKRGPTRSSISPASSPAKPSSISTRATASISTARARCSKPSAQRATATGPASSIPPRSRCSARRSPLPSPTISTSRRSPPTARRRRSGKRSSPTTPGAASATASASACRASWCGRASPTRRLRVSSPASSASRSRVSKPCCRFRRRWCIPMRARAPRSAFSFMRRVCRATRSVPASIFRCRASAAPSPSRSRRYGASPASAWPRAFAPPRIHWWRASSRAGRSASTRAARASSASRPKARSTRSCASISTKTAAARSSIDAGRHEKRASGACIPFPACGGRYARFAARVNGQCPHFRRQCARRSCFKSRHRPACGRPRCESGKLMERSDMTSKSKLYLGAAAIAAALAGSAGGLAAQQAPAVAIDNDDIGGVVTGANGPEAGVWVIAETTDLPTRYAKMVVTDDQGRYVVPDLPKAKYKVWVRGYGLVDSPKVETEPGKQLNLKAVPAPSEAEAAKYYPAIYWYSMLKIPDASQFGKKDGEIPDKVKQTDWLNLMKNNGCVGCHQLGQLSTRTLPQGLGEYANHAEAWMRRIQAGQSGALMVNIIAGQLAGAPIKYFADWTERVAKGELPKTKPTRPQGLERNIVVTTWDWGNPKKYLHDLIASDRRYPTVNAYGPVFGSPEYSTDIIPILDPKTHTVTNFKAPVRDADTPEGLGQGHAAMDKPLGPSPYWGEEKLYDTKVNNHNSMFDKQGRVWMAAAVRGPKNPDFCKQGSDHPWAKLFPLEQTHRAVSILDPKTMKYTFVDTCFQTHHLQFGYDANETVWTSGGGPVLGWVNTKMFDETGDAVKSQGWTAFVLDTNGNGKRDDYVEPDQPLDPAKDKRIAGGVYAVMPSRFAG